MYDFWVKLGVFLNELFWLKFVVVGVMVDCFVILFEEDVVGFMVVVVFEGEGCKRKGVVVDMLFFLLILVVVVGGVIVIVGVVFVEVFVCFVWGVLFILILDGVLFLGLVLIVGFIFIFMCCL